MGDDKQMKRLRKLAYSALNSTVFLVLYCVVGAYVFQQLEASAEEPRKTKQQLVDDMVLNLLNLTHLPACNNASIDDSSRCLDATKLRTIVANYSSDSLVTALNYGITSNETTWTFVRAAYYCWSLATTTGYGAFAPVTHGGKIFTMFYSVIGTPLLVLNATKLGSLFTALCTRAKNKIVKSCCRCSRRKRAQTIQSADVADPEESQAIRLRKQLDKKVSAVIMQKRRRAFRSSESLMQAWMAALVLPIYIGLVGLLVYSFEPLSYFESFYFTFATFTTMGFGDIVPTREFEFMLLSLFMFVGIGLCASYGEFMEMQLTDWSKELKQYIKDEFCEKDDCDADS